MKLTVRNLLTSGAAIAVLAAPVCLHAQSTSKQYDEILNELRQIRQLLEKIASAPSAAQTPTPPAAPAARLADLGAYMIGKADAPLTIVEFTDMQCPFCRQFHLTTFDQL